MRKKQQDDEYREYEAAVTRKYMSEKCKMIHIQIWNQRGQGKGKDLLGRVRM